MRVPWWLGRGPLRGHSATSHRSFLLILPALVLAAACGARTPLSGPFDASFSTQDDFVQGDFPSRTDFAGAFDQRVDRFVFDVPPPGFDQFVPFDVPPSFDGGGGFDFQPGFDQGGGFDFGGGFDSSMGCDVPNGSLFVDAFAGDDNVGTGSQGCPFRTITRALDVAAASGLSSILVNGSSGQIYSADIGEVFPLRPPSGMSLIGDFTNVQSTIRGNGMCTMGASCAILVDASSGSVNIQGFVIQNPQGRGVTVQGGLFLQNSVLMGSRLAGIAAENSSSLQLNGVTLIGNGTYGLHLLGSAMASVQGTIIENNVQAGLLVEGSSSIVSNGSDYSLNQGDGVIMSRRSNGSFTSDTVEQNGGHGFNLETQNMMDSPTLTLAQGTSSLNNGTAGLGHGIALGGSATLKLRNAVLFGNSGSGLDISGQAFADLGDSGHPGLTTFQSVVQPNLQAGLCNRTGKPLDAVSNIFAQCPPKLDPTSCNGPLDVGIDGPGGSVNTADCRLQ